MAHCASGPRTVSSSLDHVPTGGTYIKPGSANKLFKPDIDDFEFWYDESQWKLSNGPQEKDGWRGYLFHHISQKGYAIVFFTENEIPMVSLKESFLENMKKDVDFLKIVAEEKRTVNGSVVLCLKVQATIKQEPIEYYGYLYSGEEGTVQVATITGQSLFNKYEKVFTIFLNGLVILRESKKEGGSIPKTKFIIEGIKCVMADTFGTCVPASLATVLHLYQYSIHKDEIAKKIQHDMEATSIPAVRSFLKEMGYKFKEVIDMDPQKQRIKKHIANGYPVLITGTGSRASLGHMVVLVGFDDSRQVFYVCDPAGHGIDKVRYDELHYFHEPDCYSLVIFPKK
jgi:hypothetical protein